MKVCCTKVQPESSSLIALIQTHSMRNLMQLGTEPLYLHLFIYFPFHWVRWLAASFIFRRSALFFHLCHVFSMILLSIFAVRKGRRGGGGWTRACVCERERGRERGGEQQLFTASTRRRSCGSSAARVTPGMPPGAGSARPSQPSSSPCPPRAVRRC